jgi:hypothetical protein
MGTRVLLAVAVVGVATGLAAWAVLADVETEALSRPLHPMGAFAAPLQVKGVVRYVTVPAQRADAVAHWAFGLGLGMAAIAGLAATREPRRR